MRIHVASDHHHLTATDRRAIAAILEAGYMAGNTPRKSYRLTKDGDTYTVSITSTEHDWHGPVTRTYRVPFTVSA